MSCNGCRVLRKGCSDSCMLRHCLSGVDGPEAQGHATLFLAKFYGRAGLMGFISAVEEAQRPGGGLRHPGPTLTWHPWSARHAAGTPAGTPAGTAAGAQSTAGLQQADFGSEGSAKRLT